MCRAVRSNKAYLSCQSREQAQKTWWDALRACGFFRDLPCETVSVNDALGRVTACSVYARQSAPHYNSAAMDGIAVNARDTYGAQETAPRTLKLLPAGSAFETGGCFIVDTGDALPSGTNAVIMVEDVHFSNSTAEIIAAAAPWQHVRIIGEDIVANELVIAEHLAPAELQD